MTPKSVSNRKPEKKTTEKLDSSMSNPQPIATEPEPELIEELGANDARQGEEVIEDVVQE